jgi:hypothetical protein
MMKFAGRTVVVRIDESPLLERTTLEEDIGFLLQRDVRPIVVAPTGDIARGYVRALNRRANIAVGLSGADAALLPAGGADAVGRVQTGILASLAAAGDVPVIEPTKWRSQSPRRRPPPGRSSFMPRAAWSIPRPWRWSPN